MQKEESNVAEEDANIDLHKVQKPAVAVDIILFTVKDNDLKVGLIKREEDPYLGKYALPGRFVRYLEPIEDTARIALARKGNINPDSVFLEQLYTFGQNLHRDTRIRTISIVYYGLVKAHDIDFQSGNKFSWHSLYKLPELAFDHKEISLSAVERMRRKLLHSDLAFQLMPAEFTLTELQKTYEIILHEKLDKRNFRRKMLESGVVRGLKKKKLEGVHRPAQLFAFKRQKAVASGG